jgi:acyl-CoA synthetase (AMP-forming)/AMP-acid ligase II
VFGRVGEVIVTGGEKIWPAAVEAVIRGYPDVAEVAIVGRPDDRWGEAVEAVIVVANGRPEPTLETLRDFVKQTLPAYAAPHRIISVEALPRLPGGKIDRKRMRGTGG